MSPSSNAQKNANAWLRPARCASTRARAPSRCTRASQGFSTGASDAAVFDTASFYYVCPAPTSSRVFNARLCRRQAGRGAVQAVAVPAQVLQQHALAAEQRTQSEDAMAHENAGFVIAAPERLARQGLGRDHAAAVRREVRPDLSLRTAQGGGIDRRQLCRAQSRRPRLRLIVRHP